MLKNISLNIIVSLLFSGAALAQTPKFTDEMPMSQLTNVNQLRDVQPTSWAYEALRSLVERYGCIVGYGDQTFRGNQSLTRWEFAAGLNACMNSLEKLIAENAISPEDIQKLKRLTEDFKNELAALGTRIDQLENRLVYLEDHQFSTTTKLFGVTTLYVAGASGDRTAASFVNTSAGTQQIRPSENLLNSVEIFSEQIKLAQAQGDLDRGDTYYSHWLSALEKLCFERGLSDSQSYQNSLQLRRKAIKNTPHGVPLALENAFLSQDDHHHGHEHYPENMFTPISVVKIN